MSNVHAAEVSIPFVKNSIMSKVDRYKWKLRDAPGRLMSIPKDKLKVDDSYQRDLNEDKVKLIRSAWSWQACGALIVARRDDGNYVVDGQHRLAAAMARADVTAMPCVVFEIASVKSEARTFLSANVGRKPLTSLDKFKALILAGDEIAIEAQKMLTEVGYEASKNEKVKGVRSISSLMNCLQTDSDVFHDVWPAIVCVAQGRAIMERTICGLFWIERHKTSESLGDQRWIKRLAIIGQEALILSAARHSAAYARGGAQIWGPGMLMAINTRMHGKFKVSQKTITE